MTDRPTDPDELVSAVADSEASPPDVEFVASDLDLSARVLEVQDLSRRHRDLARSEVAASGDAEARITAAMASFGADTGAAPDATAHPTTDASTPAATGAGAAPVLTLGSSRRRRPAPALAAGIAAVVVLVVVGIVAMRNTESSDTMADGTAGRGPATTTPAAEAFHASTTAPAQMSPTVGVPALPPASTREHPEGGATMTTTTLLTTTTPPAVIPFLGEFDDLDQLVRAAMEQVDEAAALDRPSSVCPATVGSAPGTRIARATVRGTDRLVVIRDSTVTVLDPTTCRVPAP